MVFSESTSITNIIRQYLREQAFLGAGMEEGWRAGGSVLGLPGEKLPGSVSPSQGS